MNDELLQVPAELVKAEMRSLTKDAKLTFTTQQEVPPELLTQIIGHTGKTGWLSFLVCERKIDALDVVALPDVENEKGEKTKSQRLRAVIYVYWKDEKKNERTKLSSEEFYNVKMEQLIEFIRDKLPKE